MRRLVNDLDCIMLVIVSVVSFVKHCLYKAYLIQIRKLRDRIVKSRRTDGNKITLRSLPLRQHGGSVWSYPPAERIRCAKSSRSRAVMSDVAQWVMP